jgi:hypothetical protein
MNTDPGELLARWLHVTCWRKRGRYWLAKNTRPRLWVDLNARSRA